MLATEAIDVWVASASIAADGSARAHLVPLSLAWLDERVVIALDSDSLTARNITATGTARLAVGPSRDLVTIDAALEQVVNVGEAPVLAEGYVNQADWDPRTAGDGYVFLVLRPDRVQAWREVNELPGRTLMRDGRWLVG
jgi:hypothetical protein